MAEEPAFVYQQVLSLLRGFGQESELQFVSENSAPVHGKIKHVKQ